MVNGNSDPLEQLRSLTSHKAAVEAEATRNRPRGRSPVTAATAFIPPDGMQAGMSGGNYPKSGVTIRLENLQGIKVAAGADMVPPGSANTIFVAVPEKPNVNSELGQMVGSAAAVNPSIDSILDLRGTTITFDERVKEFTGRKPTDEVDDSGKAIWKDETFHIYYYHITKVSGVGVSEVATPATPTPETMAALSLFVVTPPVDLATDSIGVITKALAAAGVNLQDSANSSIQEAVLSRTLPEYVGLVRA